MTVTATRTAWRTVCPVDELEPAWGEVALLDDRQIALFRLGPGEVYAVDHLDPRTGAPVMARGIVGSKRDRPTIASPLHKEVYDLGTGECYTAPDYALGTYRTRVIAGAVEVELAS